MDPIAAARAFLPFWLPFLPLFALPFAFFGGWCLALVLTPVAYRRVLAAPDASWTERARLAWPARKMASLALILIPALLGGLLAHLGGPMAFLGKGATGLLAGAAALAGYATGMWPAARRLHGDAIGGPRRFLAGSLALLLVRAPHVVVAAAVAAFMPPRFTGYGVQAAALLAIGTVLVFASALGGGLALGRLLGLFRAGDERLARAAASGAAHAGVPLPATLVMGAARPWRSRSRSGASSSSADSALALFDDAELAAVVDHETGHLTESRAVTLQRMAGLLVFTLLMAGPSLAGEGGRTRRSSRSFSPFSALVAVGAFSRRTSVEIERRADAHAASHAGEGVYARALEKMHRAALVPAVLARRFASHPDLWDRMAAAGRPAGLAETRAPRGRLRGPPRARARRGPRLVAGEAGFVRSLPETVRKSPLAAVALTGGDAWPLSELARSCAALDGRPPPSRSTARRSRRTGGPDTSRTPRSSRATSAAAPRPARSPPTRLAPRRTLGSRRGTATSPSGRRPFRRMRIPHRRRRRRVKV